MKRCCRQDRVCAAFFVTTTALFPPAIEIRIEASTVKILLDLHQPSRKLIGMPWNPGRGRLPGFEGRRSQKNERFPRATCRVFPFRYFRPWQFLGSGWDPRPART